jgi:hypothetical protein
MRGLVTVDAAHPTEPALMSRGPRARATTHLWKVSRLRSVRKPPHPEARNETLGLHLDTDRFIYLGLAKSARRRHHSRRSRDIYAEISTLCCSAAWRGSSMPQSFHGAVSVCDPPTLLSIPQLNLIQLGARSRFARHDTAKHDPC